MQQTCKICSFQTDSTYSFFSHFFLAHRVGVKSFFECGFSGCSSKFSVAKRYGSHVKTFHAQEDAVQPSAAVAAGLHGDHGSVESRGVEESSVSDVLKCFCGYVCNNPSTLRSHRFWKHKNREETNVCNDDSIVDDPDIVIDSVPCSEFVEKDQTIGRDSFGCAALSEEPCSENSSSADGNLCPEDDLLKKLAHLYLTLAAKHHVPESTLQVLIEKYHLILKESLSVLKKNVLDGLVVKGVDCAIAEPVLEDVFRHDIAVKLHSPEGDMRTAYMRDRQYSRFFKYVAPVGYELGPDENNKMAVCHYVPIAESLTVLLQDESVLKQVKEKGIELSQPPSAILRDITDGSLVRNHELSRPDTLFLILYGDDVEIVKNSLGSAKGKHKTSCWYYSLANLQPWNRSCVELIQLALLCKEKHVSYFGIQRVLEPLIKDLKDLKVKKISVEGTLMNVVLLVKLGDNLDQHVVFCMQANFSLAKYFCRYCEEIRDAWISRWKLGTAAPEFREDSDSTENSREEREDDPAGDACPSDEDGGTSAIPNEETRSKDDDDQSKDAVEVLPVATAGDEGCSSHLAPVLGREDATPVRLAPGPLRTTQSYARCIDQLEEHPEGVKGIVGPSPLLDAPSYHVVDGTPPCIDHDLFEGVVPYDVMLVLQHFKKRYRLEESLINRRLKAFKLLGREGRDKPPPVSLGASKLKGHAVQNAVFLYFLPHLINDHIDTDDRVWRMLTLLNILCKVLTSPQFRRESLPHLASLIFEYLSLRSSLFPEVKLRPKHHFLEHYPHLIEVYGPPKKVSTLIYEQHHKLFKEAAAAAKNFKNPTYTLARCHQLNQASLSVAPLFNSESVMEDSSPYCELSEVVRNVLRQTFGENVACSLMCSEKLRFRNIDYRKGDVVVVLSKSDFSLDLCKISSLVLTKDGTPYVVGNKCRAKLDPTSSVHYLSESERMVVLSLSDLPDYVSYPVYGSHGKFFLVVHHLCC